MKIDREEKWINSYCSEVEDLMNNEKIQQMKNYPHHKTISTHFHSVYVSYSCHKVGRLLGIGTRELTRAALMHDLYLYDWHTEKHEEKHAWYHPKMAVINAEKYVEKLSDKQKDMILAHMFPLHIAPPKSIEGFVLTLCDKHCANMDIFTSSVSFKPIYNEILKRTEK